MENKLVEIFIVIVSVIIGLFLKDYLPSYSNKKGENLATKEDITEITEKIESVKADKESEKWLRDSRQNAYHNALKYLFRVGAIGARIGKTNIIQLPQDAHVEWYDDIAEANAWLTTVHYYCSREKFDLIGSHSTEFFNLSNRLIGFHPRGTYSKERYGHIISEKGELEYQNFIDYMNNLITDISNSARHDLGSLDFRYIE